VSFAPRASLTLSALGVAATIAALVGCGSKSDVYGRVPRGPRADAGLDDLGVDGDVPDLGPGLLEVDCGRRERFTSPRRPLAITAMVDASAPIASRAWTLVDAPAGSMPGVTAADDAVGIEPDVEGAFTLRYEVADVEGRAASCEVVVRAIVGPPAALCPEESLSTAPGVPLTIVGDGYDDVRVTSYAWSVRTAPMGAMVNLDPRDRPSTVFVSDVTGEYEVELTVGDVDGGTGSCIALVRVGGGPVVTCPDSPISAPTREPLTLRAEAMDDGGGPVTTRWELVRRPPPSAATITPTTGSSTTLTPDKVGAYLVRFTATDVDGLEAGCEVTVDATPTPPDAICPPVIETTPLSTVSITGSGVDDGTIVAYRWSSVDIPAGSSSTPPAPADAATTRFNPDVAGDYTLQLTVTDDDGQTGTCETVVRALVAEGLRVELYWNPPDRSCHTSPGTAGCDSSDVDFHLLHPMATRWFDDALDCYYSTCIGDGLSWFEAGRDDDPRLDLDQTDGFGPENINIDVPATATYRVGAHFFSDDGMGPAEVYVNVYCGVGSSAPIASFGPVTLRNDQFWKVADVAVGGGGCRVTDLRTPSGPNVVTQAQARAAR
jgi:hypothetical protein